MNLCRNEVIPENNVTLNFGVFESILKNRLYRVNFIVSRMDLPHLVLEPPPEVWGLRLVGWPLPLLEVPPGESEAFWLEPPQVRRVG